MRPSIIKGVALAPLAPCVLLATVQALRDGSLLAIPIGTLFYATFAYPLMLILGLPAHALLRRYGLTSARQTLATGGALGAGSALALPLLDGFGKTTPLDWLPTLAVFAGSGIVTAALFWYLAIREPQAVPASGDGLRTSRPTRT